MRINLEGFIFPVAGGERVVNHADGTFPSGAEFVSYDNETMTVTYTVEDGIDENGQPILAEQTKIFTEEEIPNA